MSQEATTFLQLVEACDNYPYEDGYDSRFYRLYLPDDGEAHGYMLPETVARMLWTAGFHVDAEKMTIQLADKSEGTDTGHACTAAFSELVTKCIEQDVFATIHGKHSEPFAVLGAHYPVQIERFAAPLFGIVSRGAHLTAYVNSPSGMKIWVPRRSAESHTYPNKLDTTVAGGVPATETPFDNIVHEADEEASLSADLVRREVRSAGVLTYIGVSSKGGAAAGDQGLIIPDTVYLFDIELSKEVVCTPRDHEVQEYYLMTVDEVKEALLRQEFKTNSAVVMIDFLIRHGVITAENEKDYVELVMRMHRTLPFRTRTK